MGQGRVQEGAEAISRAFSSNYVEAALSDFLSQYFPQASFVSLSVHVQGDTFATAANLCSVGFCKLYLTAVKEEGVLQKLRELAQGTFSCASVMSVAIPATAEDTPLSMLTLGYSAPVISTPCQENAERLASALAASLPATSQPVIQTICACVLSPRCHRPASPQGACLHGDLDHHYAAERPRRRVPARAAAAAESPGWEQGRCRTPDQDPDDPESSGSGVLVSVPEVGEVEIEPPSTDSSGELGSDLGPTPEPRGDQKASRGEFSGGGKPVGPEEPGQKAAQGQGTAGGGSKQLGESGGSRGGLSGERSLISGKGAGMKSFSGSQQGQLLAFADPHLERAFSLWQGCFAKLDILFCCIIFVLFCIPAFTEPYHLVTRNPLGCALGFGQMLPLLIMSISMKQYIKIRERILVGMMLLGAITTAFVTTPNFLGLVPNHEIGHVSWLLRLTGVELLGMSTLGYRLRISSVLPMLCVSCALQLVNFPVLCSRLAADPGMAAAVCSSTPTWGSVGCWGSLMGLMFGGMIGIPGVIVYCLESRSRRLWLRTSHAQEILAASAISAS